MASGTRCSQKSCMTWRGLRQVRETVQLSHPAGMSRVDEETWRLAWKSWRGAEQLSFKGSLRTSVSGAGLEADREGAKRDAGLEAQCSFQRWEAWPQHAKSGGVCQRCGRCLCYHEMYDDILRRAKYTGTELFHNSPPTKPQPRQARPTQSKGRGHSKPARVTTPCLCRDISNPRASSPTLTTTTYEGKSVTCSEQYKQVWSFFFR